MIGSSEDVEITDETIPSMLNASDPRSIATEVVPIQHLSVLTDTDYRSAAKVLASLTSTNNQD